MVKLAKPEFLELPLMYYMGVTVLALSWQSQYSSHYHE